MSKITEFILMSVLGLFFIAIVFSVCFTVYDRYSNYDNLVHVKTNTLGCNKYRLHGDEWWECPKDLDIKQIEERVSFNRGSVPKQVPVIGIDTKTP